MKQTATALAALTLITACGTNPIQVAPGIYCPGGADHDLQSCAERKLRPSASAPDSSPDDPPDDSPDDDDSDTPGNGGGNGGGNGNPGNGNGPKGNNGHGNGAEGASPGRGHGANDDESGVRSPGRPDSPANGGRNDRDRQAG